MMMEFIDPNRQFDNIRKTYTHLKRFIVLFFFFHSTQMENIKRKNNCCKVACVWLLIYN